MNLWLIILIVLIIAACGGGFTGAYPHTTGFGLGGILLVVLLVLLLTGRL
jgi:hypothetical protein